MYRTSMDPMGSGGLNVFGKQINWPYLSPFTHGRFRNPLESCCPCHPDWALEQELTLAREHEVKVGIENTVCLRYTYTHTTMCMWVNFICPSLTFTFQSSLLWHQMNPNDYLRSDSSTNDQAVFVGLPGFAKSCLASIVFWLDVAPSVVALSANKNLKEHNLLDTLPIFWCTSCKFVYLPKKHTFLVCQDTWNSPVLAEKENKKSPKKP